MARLVHDANLETRTARSRLDARGKPYYRAVQPGLHLGYRKPQQGAGKWVVALRGVGSISGGNIRHRGRPFRPGRRCNPRLVESDNGVAPLRGCPEKIIRLAVHALIVPKRSHCALVPQSDLGQAERSISLSAVSICWLKRWR
jgi:hypothetical protein